MMGIFEDIGYPISLVAKATASYSRERKETIFDSKVFPDGTTKIESRGLINKKPVAIRYEDGKIQVTEIKTSKEKLEELEKQLKEYKKMLNDGLIDDDEHKDLKKKLLDEM